MISLSRPSLTSKIGLELVTSTESGLGIKFLFLKRELRCSKRPVEGVFSGLPAGWWLRQKRF